ncbi:MAG: hypothetical protein PWP28_319 [Oceanotoga sp.]|jgi:hypothetical protein|uniref:Uncharacterized protein n=1 Tax=Oceanotoga teriensis TaxID=515440 RepID=A0AA45C717_9BACT|nr:MULTISPECIES: hypothetical protein [Oceanotoga]MDN5341444.1 hypothetical protein [Oceanotoga sp.]PWJ95102.1 hypothetical protein C7380_10757 [Oceanotoga teriensis]
MELNLSKRNLIVSLPENTLEYALEAEKMGADAVKLHINVKHRVTKKIHDSWNSIKNETQRIINTLNIPVGIVPGAELMCSKQDIKEFEDFKLDFLDCYIEYYPIWMNNTKLKKMFAINYDDDLELIKEIEHFNPDIIEASIINPSEYGKNYTIKDILKFKKIISNTKLPVYIPSQKIMEYDDLKEFIKIGAKGFIIGPIVTTTEIKTFSKKIFEIKNCIEKL